MGIVGIVGKIVGKIVSFPHATHETHATYEPYRFTVAGAQYFSKASVRFFAIMSAD